MNAVLFAAHNDDETLWSFTNILRYKPKVIVVYRSFKEREQGGPAYFVREAETDRAMSIAGVEWEQWSYPDNRNPALDVLDFRAAASNADLIIAPAYEHGGHEQHNEVAGAVDSLPRAEHHNFIRYLSYVRGHGRSEGIEVVPTVEEAALKREALACYASQATYPPTASWFGSDQREFVA